VELILVRHGQSESNARLTTELDASLTPLGKTQAKATADHLLRNVLTNSTNTAAAVLVSPFRRTLQTCEPLASQSSFDVRIYPPMCEYFCSDIDAYSEFKGLSSVEISTQFSSVCKSDAGIHPVWWPEKLEDVSDIYDRMAWVKNDLWNRYGDADIQVVIYSHAEPIGRLIEVLQGIDPNPGWPPWTENCGINRLTVYSNDLPATVTILNDTSHLSALGLISPTYI
jgi:broad specificity phosphatase PhoE